MHLGRKDTWESMLILLINDIRYRLFIKWRKRKECRTATI